MIPKVYFVGKSNSGKTTLLERVIRELKSRGYRVGVIKHAHHGFEIDQPGKDSWRLTQAGSDVVALSSPNKVALIERVDTERSSDQIEALFLGKVDIVLVEGYKNTNAAKVLVLGSDEDQELLCHDEALLATVSAHLSPFGMVQFDDEDVIRVVNLLMELMNKKVRSDFSEDAHFMIPGTLDLTEESETRLSVAAYHKQ